MYRLIPLALLVAVACGCGSSSSPATPTTTSAPYSQTDLVVGTGATASIGNTVTVSYTGWLHDSSKTDAKGQIFQPAATSQFALTSGSLIEGWIRGVPGMRVGGQRRLVIPPELAYGSAGRPPSIPPNATLVFEIGLISIP